MKAIAIQRKQMILPNSKIIIDAILGPDALMVWFAASFLWLINKITITDSMGWVENGTTIFVSIGGIYGLLRMHENWLESRAKRKLAEHNLEEQEDHDEADNIVKMKNTK